MVLLFQSSRKVFPGIYCKSGLVIRRAPDPSQGGVILIFSVTVVAVKGLAASDHLLGGWLGPLPRSPVRF